MIFFAFMSFIFNPKQKEYYWEKDIRSFKENYYLSIALFSSGALIFMILIVGFLKKFKFNQILNSIIFISFICFSIFFLMQNTVTCFCLWINRLDTKKEVIRSYEIVSITDNKYFTAENINQPKDFIDESDYYKYSGKDASKLKSGDTITIKLKQGLLDINYFTVKK